MKRLNFKNTRLIVFILLAAGLVLLFVAAWAFEVGSGPRNIFTWSAVIMYLVAVVLMGIGFKCPKCGCRFFRAALFLKSCPKCGADFVTYEEDGQSAAKSG